MENFRNIICLVVTVIIAVDCSSGITGNDPGNQDETPVIEKSLRPGENINFDTGISSSDASKDQFWFSPDGVPPGTTTDQLYMRLGADGTNNWHVYGSAKSKGQSQEAGFFLWLNPKNDNSGDNAQCLYHFKITYDK
jgi:hypothetical protein